MTIVSIGGISTDVVATVDALPAAGVCRPASAFAEGVGGKGANQAVAAARLGAGVLLIGAVGDDDRGRRLLARLEAESVNVAHVIRAGGAATGAFVLVRDGEGTKQATVLPGANALLTPERVEDAADLIRAARAVLVQLEIPLDSVLRAARIAHDAGVPLFLDPSPVRSLPDELLRRASAIKPNAQEARALTGIDVHDRATARSAARALLDRGVALAVVEAGGDGNLFLTRDEEIFVPKLAVPSVDRLGAGDALTAALAVALTESMPLARAARFASAAAALTTRGLGAQTAMPGRAEVEALLQGSL
jgi:ribokinase